jgi:hypothetical protein
MRRISNDKVRNGEGNPSPFRPAPGGLREGRFWVELRHRTASPTPIAPRSPPHGEDSPDPYRHVGRRWCPTLLLAEDPR